MEDFMNQSHQVSKMSNDLPGKRLLHGLRWAGSRAIAGALIALLVLPAAQAQSIKPLYYAFFGLAFQDQGPTDGTEYEAQDFASIVALNLASLPGWVVGVNCYYNGDGFPLVITVWQDTGTTLQLMGAYGDSSASCVGVSVASLNNTSAEGYTTIVVGTIQENPSTGPDPLHVQAYQVGPTGSIAPIGTPGIDSAYYYSVSMTPLLVGSTFMTDGYDGGVNTEIVDTWSVAANGDITMLDSAGGPLGSFPNITYLSPTQAAAAGPSRSNYNLELVTWGISIDGKLTQQDTLTTDVQCPFQLPQVPQCDGPFYSIAPYFLASGPAVIVGAINQSMDLELMTYGVSSSGKLTPEINLVQDPVSSAGIEPAVSFIPGSDLAVVAEYGGNNVLDVNAWNQNGSGLYEQATYHTSLAQTYPTTPQGIAPLSNNRFATLTFNASTCNSNNCNLDLYVWQYTP
jgi:hypothetical protein